MRRLNKKNINRGFSLVELIVVIAIMVVLAGVLVPQLMKYVTSQRQKSCRENRESILNIYAKAVYAGDLVSSGDLNDLANNNTAGSASYTGNEEYFTQALEYVKCPAGGTYTGYVEDGYAYIICNCDNDGDDKYDHDSDVCSIDLVGWLGTEYEAKADPTFDVPITPASTPTAAVSPNATPTVVPTQATSKSGVWPYVYHDDGTLDERWYSALSSSGQVAGPVPGAYVNIELPKYGHFIDEKTGNEYVIIKAMHFGSGTSDGTYDYYSVKYEWSLGPGAIDSYGWDAIVKYSGVTYDSETSLPTYMPGTENWAVRQYLVSYGDMIVMHYSSGAEYTFIYGSMNTSGYVNLPTESTVGTPAYGKSYDNWYLVPPLATED